MKNGVSGILEKVKLGGTKVAPFVIAMSLLSGCGNNKNISEAEVDRPITTLDTVCELVSDLVSVVSDEAEKAEMIALKEKSLYTTFSSWGYELEKIDSNYYKVIRDNNQNITYCDSIDDFKKYVDVKNPTFEDVRNAIYENPSITSEYQDILIEGLNNLEIQNNDLDLTILYYNIKRLEFVEISVSEMMDKIGFSGAYYNVEDGKVFVDSNRTPYVVLHEVLGHAISDIKMAIGDDYVFYMPDCLAVKVDFDNDDYSFEFLGTSLEEGKADLVANKAYNTTMQGPYDMEAEQLRIFNEVSNTSLNEFINNGVVGLVSNMKENDIDKPVEYIMSVDSLLDCVQERILIVPEENTMKYNMTEFFKDYADDKINAGTDRANIEDYIEEIFDASDYEHIEAGELFIYDSVDVDELKDHVVGEIDTFDTAKVKAYR